MTGSEPPQIDPATLNEQQLVDYLVVASSEQDILFVAFWLKRLKERGVEDAGKLKDLRSNRSALTVAASAEKSPLRLFILQLLLLSATTAVSEVVQSLELEQWARDVVASWETEGRAGAADAAHLLSLEDDGAVADWIDANLPPPPSPNDLTGCRPLPPVHLHLSPAAPQLAESTPETSISAYFPLYPPSASLAGPPSPFSSPAASATALLKASTLLLRPIPYGFTGGRLLTELPHLSHLKHFELIAGEKLARATFTSPTAAREAMRKLVGVKVGETLLFVETEQQARSSLPSSTAPSPAIPAVPHLPAKPAINNSKGETTLSFPPLNLPPPDYLSSCAVSFLNNPSPPLSAIAPSNVPLDAYTSHSIPLQLSNLPPTVSLEETLRYLPPVTPSSASLCNDAQGQVLRFSVPDHVAWFEVERATLRATIHGRVLHLDREPLSSAEQLSPERPKILVEDTSGRELTPLEVTHLSDATRCGAYNRTTVFKPASLKTPSSSPTWGTFRVSSPPSAERAVKMLDGLDLGRGRTIKARWEFPKRAKQKKASQVASLPPRVAALPPRPPSAAYDYPPHLPYGAAFPPTMRIAPAPSLPPAPSFVDSRSWDGLPRRWNKRSWGEEAVDEFGRTKRFKAD
ncbi:hypothetical protein JCM6882_000154 [Rhodosporidiobolus microsporus]